MRVGVTGATGFVGRAVVEKLRHRGDDVTMLTRDPEKARPAPGVRAVRFDARETSDPHAFEGLDAIVHLAGESVDGRWTPAKKRAIFDSRVAGTRNLVEALSQCKQRPEVLVCASASGYYGDRGDEPLDEKSPPGSDFLAGVCIAWEREAQAAMKLGMRVALMRTSPVFGDGGALGKLVPIFKLGIGGPSGSGRQWMPWIHQDDLARLYCFALDRRDIRGPMCAAAPDYATNHRVMQGLGHALGRPALVPVPGFALKLAVGEFGESVLGGQLIIPAKALDAGFAWEHAELEASLIDLLAPSSGRKPALQRLATEQFIPAASGDVFDFFANAEHLARVAPPNARFRVIESPKEFRRGATIDYEVRARGLRMRWRSMIGEWQRPVRFADVQVRGPFLVWKHSHEFEEQSGGVIMRDRLTYALPWAPLSGIALGAVRRDIESAFAFRRRAIAQIFGG